MTDLACCAYGLKMVRYFSPPPTLLSIFLGPGLLPCDRFVCPFADDHKICDFCAMSERYLFSVS